MDRSVRVRIVVPTLSTCDVGSPPINCLIHTRAMQRRQPAPQTPEYHLRRINFDRSIPPAVSTCLIGRSQLLICVAHSHHIHASVYSSRTEFQCSTLLPFVTLSLKQSETLLRVLCSTVRHPRRL